MITKKPEEKNLHNKINIGGDVHWSYPISKSSGGHCKIIVKWNSVFVYFIAWVELERQSREEIYGERIKMELEGNILFRLLRLLRAEGNLEAQAWQLFCTEKSAGPGT